MLASVGEPIAIRRYSGTGSTRTFVEALVTARVVGYQPQEIVGTIIQGDRKVITLNDPAALVPDGKVSFASLLPLSNADKAVIRTRECAIKAVDDNTRRIAGVLIALELQVAG